MRRSHKSIMADRARRSTEPWERGLGARRIGNPRYKPKRVRGRDGRTVKVYVLRKR